VPGTINGKIKLHVNYRADREREGRGEEEEELLQTQLLLRTSSSLFLPYVDPGLVAGQ
jgi:hypothetical protein